METISFHLKGKNPCLMQADTLANPLDPLTRGLKRITGKRKKTESDHEEIARIEFVASLYYDETVGPYWPAQNVERMFFDSAKLSRRGQDVKRAIQLLDDRVVLLYDGPRTPEKLYADKRFVDMRSVVVRGARTMRCRPIFREWAVKFEAVYEPDIFNRETVQELADTAGKYIGLSCFRPRFGRFDIVNGG